ncbi:unnamed protein product, partial [Musa hybrid cultivar]
TVERWRRCDRDSGASSPSPPSRPRLQLPLPRRRSLPLTSLSQARPWFILSSPLLLCLIFSVFYATRVLSVLRFDGLSKRTTSEGLREAFSKFGQIVYARVVTDRISGFSKGFGFVRYATLEEAAEGIKGMDGKFLDGWVIFAEYARPRLPPSGPTQPQTPPPQTSEPSSGF